MDKTNNQSDAGVTQADREAAKECAPYYAGMLDDYGEKTEQESWDNYWSGKYDHFRHIQHFARHRQAAIAQHEGDEKPVADDDFGREYNGHVSPALVRLKWILDRIRAETGDASHAE